MTHECDHPDCECRWDIEDLIERDEGYYCSHHCIAEGPSSNELCECGHPECGVTGATSADASPAGDPAERGGGLVDA